MCAPSTEKTKGSFHSTVAAAAAALVALVTYRVSVKLGPNFTAGPASLVPAVPPLDDAVGVYANPHLSAGNKLLEYIFPALLDVGSMIPCSILSPDLACMSGARTSTVDESSFRALLKTHEETTIDIERDGGGLPLKVVLLLPRNRNPLDPPPPLIVWFHGGGFVVGGARDGYLASLIPQTSGDAVWASVEYRLAPENPYPAAPDDCFLALKHLLNKFKLPDGTRFGKGGVHLAGVSAGGTLVLETALRAMHMSLQVDSVFADEPVLPLHSHKNQSADILSVFDSKSYRRNWYSRIPGVAWTEWFWGAYTGCPQQGPELSEAEKNGLVACHHASDYFIGGVLSVKEWGKAKRRNGGTLPPLLVVTSKGDIFADGATPLIEAYSLADSNVAVKHVEALSSHGVPYLMDSKAASEVFSSWNEMVEKAKGLY
uniref:Alpha/beta hydrolase fold-3 domain-containing protein n=1 Tax=Trieres chinensis TaxID=1514140 RepID=A0A7S2EUR3_TRICV|mmetsp:Transcript_4338/g.9160  ORF Transcript_4338/g.9160 Transcript_4338/m.9160 type:complete len:429 (+) Transcript_4338:41-1327(+)